MENKSKNLYFAQAGELFVASELLSRFWNVAFPRVDRGVDAIIVNDENNTTNFPIQVKAANAQELKNGIYKAKYSAPERQLQTQNQNLKLRFAFVIRENTKWAFVLLIPSDKMRELYLDGYLGKANEKGALTFAIKYQYKNSEIDVFIENSQEEKGYITRQSLTHFVNAYPDLPPPSAQY